MLINELRDTFLTGNTLTTYYEDLYSTKTFPCVIMEYISSVQEPLLNTGTKLTKTCHNYALQVVDMIKNYGDHNENSVNYSLCANSVIAMFENLLVTASSKIDYEIIENKISCAHDIYEANKVFIMTCIVKISE